MMAVKALQSRKWEQTEVNQKGKVSRDPEELKQPAGFSLPFCPGSHRRRAAFDRDPGGYYEAGLLPELSEISLEFVKQRGAFELKSNALQTEICVIGLEPPARR